MRELATACRKSRRSRPRQRLDTAREAATRKRSDRAAEGFTAKRTGCRPHSAGGAGSLGSAATPAGRRKVCAARNTGDVTTVRGTLRSTETVESEASASTVSDARGRGRRPGPGEQRPAAAQHRREQGHRGEHGSRHREIPSNTLTRSVGPELRSGCASVPGLRPGGLAGAQHHRDRLSEFASSWTRSGPGSLGGTSRGRWHLDRIWGAGPSADASVVGGNSSSARRRYLSPADIARSDAMRLLSVVGGRGG